MKTKKCNGICGLEKPISEFNERKDYKTVGFRNQCKKCQGKGVVKEILPEGFKICSNPECNEVKPLSDFIKGHNKCKLCRSKIRKESYKNNREEILKNNKEYYKNNREEILIVKRQYHQKNKEGLNKSSSLWTINHYKNDSLYRFSHSMRRMLRRTLKLIGTKKEGRTKDELGYSPEKLKLRMEMNFTDEMSHDSYGKKSGGVWGWEIDHTIPVDRFLKRGVIDPKIINALSNLKPMWRTSRTINGVFHLGNLNKGNKILKV